MSEQVCRFCGAFPGHLITCPTVCEHEDSAAKYVKLKRESSALLDEAEKIILAQQDLLICYRIGKRPAEKTLNTLTKSNPGNWLEKKRKAGEG